MSKRALRLRGSDHHRGAHPDLIQITLEPAKVTIRGALPNGHPRGARSGQDRTDRHHQQSSRDRRFARPAPACHNGAPSLKKPDPNGVKLDPLGVDLDPRGLALDLPMVTLDQIRVERDTADVTRDLFGVKLDPIRVKHDLKKVELDLCGVSRDQNGVIFRLKSKNVGQKGTEKPIGGPKLTGFRPCANRGVA